MPRMPRLLVKGEPAIYHVMSRTALDGFVLQDMEKEYLLYLIKHLSTVYFSEILGFCIMDNHFHLVIRMLPGDQFSDREIAKRYQRYYTKKYKNHTIHPGQIPFYRRKWSCLSCLLKEIKQRFSCYYNKLHNRIGYFWGDRFKGVLVEEGHTLINCLAYVELNPVRAALVNKPEEYRWCSLGYHIQTNNRNNLLVLDFGLEDSGLNSSQDRLRAYQKYVYAKGDIIAEDAINFGNTRESVNRFKYRCRYFTDSGIIGTKTFVRNCYRLFMDKLPVKKTIEPKAINGLPNLYCLKHLPG